MKIHSWCCPPAPVQSPQTLDCLQRALSRWALPPPTQFPSQKPRRPPWPLAFLHSHIWSLRNLCHFEFQISSSWNSLPGQGLLLPKFSVLQRQCLEFLDYVVSPILQIHRIKFYWQYASYIEWAKEGRKEVIIWRCRLWPKRWAGTGKANLQVSLILEVCKERIYEKKKTHNTIIQVWNLGNIPTPIWDRRKDREKKRLEVSKKERDPTHLIKLIKIYLWEMDDSTSSSYFRLLPNYDFPTHLVKQWHMWY